MFGYCRNIKYFLGVSLVATAFRYYLAATLPISNDEAYYFNWAYELHLSYFDHPPGVAWLAYISRLVFGGHLAARGLSPIIYLVASLLLWECYRNIAKPAAQDIPRASFLFGLLISVFPPLSLWGVTLLPDVGLLLSISIVLYLVLNYREAEKLTVMQGVLLGLALGMGGLFKYHILLVGGGLCIALFIQRMWYMQKLHEWHFWLTAFLFGLLATSPVWIWNYQNNFEGILFQTNHGFADGKFQIGRIAQVLLLLVFIATPGLLWIVLRHLFTFRLLKTKDSAHLYYVLGIGVLFAVLFYSALFKQPLPHWFYPGFWVAFPFVYNGFIQLPRVLIATSIAVALIIGMVLPVAVGLQPVQSYVIEKFPSQDIVRAFTFWDDLNNLLDYEEMEKFLNQPVAEGVECTGPQYASFRWFWVAQMNYRWSRKWKSVDAHDKSYYHYLYPEKPNRGCGIILVGDNQHIHQEVLQSEFNVREKSYLYLPRYEGITVAVIFAQYK